MGVFRNQSKHGALAQTAAAHEIIGAVRLNTAVHYAGHPQSYAPQPNFQNVENMPQSWLGSVTLRFAKQFRIVLDRSAFA